MKKHNYELKYDLKTIVDSWLDHEGFPILNVVRDYDTKTVTINQKRFFWNDTNSKEKIINHNWYVPINIATKKNPDFSDTTAEMWLNNSSINISIDADAEDWILLNKQQTGTHADIEIKKFFTFKQIFF